jgi:hypothetical protein
MPRTSRRKRRDFSTGMGHEIGFERAGAFAQ